MIEDASEEHVLFAEVDILRELPQSELEYIATRCSIVHLGKKESLTLGGDRRGVLFLISGRVRVHEAAFGNQDLTFSVVESATVVGRQTSSTPRSLRLEALEPSVLRVL